MPKTPPVVIPVIVDATGVDRGIADANRRLRYGTRGMAGTPSGFGSGGGPVAQGGGVGGFAGGIAAGAVAGAVAGRVAKTPAERTRELITNFVRNASGFQLSQVSAKIGRMYSRRIFGPGNEQLPLPTAPNSMMSAINNLNNLQFARNMSANRLSRGLYRASTAVGQFGAGLQSRGTLGLAAGGTITGMGDILGLGALGAGVAGRKISRMPSVGNMGKAVSKALGLAGMGRFAGLGAAGAIPAVIGGAINFQSTMRQSFQDLTPFEGTLNYNAARRIRAYYNAPERQKPGFFQEFGLGAEMVNQGGGTSLLGAYTTTISEHYRAMARTAGALLTSPFETISAMFDPNSELRQANKQAYSNIFDEWKRIMY